MKSQVAESNIRFMLAIRLPAAIKSRLDALAKATGRTITFAVLEDRPLRHDLIGLWKYRVGD